MSLVSGPGRGGSHQLPTELQLCAQKHVEYIQSLDTVGTTFLAYSDRADTDKLVAQR